MPKENHKDTQPLIQAELESYSALLADIRAMIKQAQGRAYQAVDNIRVQAYWQIGERIVRAELEHQDRAEYGQEVIKRLGDLEEKIFVAEYKLRLPSEEEIKQGLEKSSKE